MIAFEKLIALFDLGEATVWPVRRPTAESIGAINRHFGVSLPPLLIKLAQQSERFGAHFASLGDDFENDFHIIRVNRLFASKRRRTPQGWRRAKPEYLLVFNHGHDDDCDCLDLRSWNPESGDYRVRYWTPSDRERAPVPDHSWLSFHAYFEHLALPDLARLRGERREQVMAILRTE